MHKFRIISMACCCCSVIKQSPTLLQPCGLQPPVSSVHGILQARILEWIAISFSRGLPDPGIKPVSPVLAGKFFTTKVPGKHSMITIEIRAEQFLWEMQGFMFSKGHLWNFCYNSDNLLFETSDQYINFAFYYYGNSAYIFYECHIKICDEPK